ALVTKVLDHVRARGHAVRVALADGAFVARAIARYGGREKAIALPGKSDRALAPLPLPALDLDEENLSWLARLGFHTVGDLANLPPKSLGTRLGSLAPRILPLLRGEDPSPLVPYVPVACPEEPATFEYGVESTEALLFVAKRLCERLSERLRGRALGITNLQIVLGLDRAFAKENPTEILPFALSAPILEADDLFSLVKARFDSYELAAPALSMILRAEETVPLERSQIHLFVPEPKAKRVLPRLAAELEAELGPNRVGVLVLGNRWLPADRSVLVPFGSPDAKKPWVQTCVPRPEPRKAPRLSGAPEPVRLLHDPVPLPPTLSEAPDLQKERLFRLASVEWWNRGAEAITFEAVWLPNGSAWAFVERTSRGSFIRGWMDG
ncbi:MAG: hypothetical protein U0169_24385, partial [Polyangiaceae bacterium]